MRRLLDWIAIPPGATLPSPWPLVVALIIGAGAPIAADHGIAALYRRVLDNPATTSAGLNLVLSLGTNGLIGLMSVSGKVIVIGLLIAMVHWCGWRFADAFQTRTPASEIRTSVHVAIALFGAWIVLILIRFIAEGGFDEAQKAVGLAHVFTILSTAIIGPLTEELIYRGIVFPALLRNGLGFFIAAIVSSILWALQHYQYGWPTQMELVFAGTMACWALAKTQSLWPGLAVHAFWNGCLFGLQALFNT